MLALLIRRQACHSNRSRHTLHKFFPSLASLFETARRCVQRTREVGNVQTGGSATLGQGVSRPWHSPGLPQIAIRIRVSVAPANEVLAHMRSAASAPREPTKRPDHSLQAAIMRVSKLSSARDNAAMAQAN